jgi:hypothetical protein
VTENDSSSAPDRNLLTTFEILPPAILRTRVAPGQLRVGSRNFNFRLPTLTVPLSLVRRELAFESRCGARLASSERNEPAVKKAFRRNPSPAGSGQPPAYSLRLILASAAFWPIPLGKRRERPATGVYEHDCTGLSLVAIVVAGLTCAFGEGGSKRVLAGVLFGVGMAIAAANFLSWLFPGT